MDRFIDSALGHSINIERVRFSPEALQDIPEEIRKELVEKAEEEKKGGFPYLPLSLYRDFSRTGNRKNFENIYFQKRRTLSDLVIAEAVTGDGRFIEDIEEGLWSIISEPAWTIPAHNTYIRDTEQLDAPLIERPILDLFQCETGEIIALTLSILQDKLDPIIVKDAEHVLRERILKPYMTDHFWWMGNDGYQNNWSPWCTQNVLLAVFSALELSEKEKGKAIRTAIATLDQYIDSYPDDGGCDEGASYYHAAALALWGSLYIISLATGNQLSAVFSNPKIKAMAEYVEKVHISADDYLNFADCSPKAGHLGAREYLFGKAVGSQALMHHAASDFASVSWKESDNTYNLFYKYIALSKYREIIDASKSKYQKDESGFTSFPGIGLAIYREKGIVFAIKGGNNGESHNHNDVGSFILYKDGKPCLIDIGVETYTKTTFSDKRYTLLPMRSTYHNLVNFPPLEEHDVKAFHAITLQMDETTASFDLSAAYEKDKGLRKYVRTAVFDRDKGSITITEDYDADNPAVLSLISVEKPEWASDALIWSSFRASFSGKISTAVETLEIKDARLRMAWPDKIYRALITLSGPLSWTISFTKEEGE